MSFDFSLLTGALGGTIALSWGAGAASGYTFAYKIMKARIAYLQEQIKLSDEKCDARLDEMSRRFESEIQTIKEMSKEAINQAKEAQKLMLEIQNKTSLR